MVLFGILDQLFRLDFTPAKALVFGNLLWVLFIAFVIVFFVPDKWKWHAGGILAACVLLASMDLSFFVGIISWNVFIIGAVLVVVASDAKKKDVFWPTLMLLVMLCAFGPLLTLLGWRFSVDWLFIFVLVFIIHMLFENTKLYKILDPYLTNLIVLALSWFIMFHW